MMRWFVLLLPLAEMTLQVQSANNQPDFTGVWAIYRIARGWLALRDRKPMYE